MARVQDAVVITPCQYLDMADIAPSIITVIGTISGGILAGGIAFWSAHLTRKGDAERDRVNHQQSLYNVWLQTCHDVEDVIEDDGGDAASRRVREGEKFATEVKSKSSNNMLRQVDLSVGLWHSWLDALTDEERSGFRRQISDQRMATAECVRVETLGPRRIRIMNAGDSGSPN